MSSLLNYSAIDPVNIFQTARLSYLNTQTGEIEQSTNDLPPSSIISATISGTQYTCKLDYSTGAVLIHPTPHDEKEMIRFAHMGSDSVWEPDINREPSAESPTLTSSIPNIRARYRSLKPESQVQFPLNPTYILCSKESLILYKFYLMIL